MRNVIIFICIGICSFCSFSQIRVGFDSDCLLGNSAILSDAMINCFGEDSVKHWIDNNINITFIISIDSTGRTQKINRIWTKKAFSLDLVQLIEDYLITSGTHFSVCYFKDPPDITEELIVNGVREDFMENRYKNIAVGFPGGLLSSYNLKKEEFVKKGIHLSKFEYLMMQIKNSINTDL